MFVTIPVDPARPEYRQGNTLGDDYKHWFRAKCGGQRLPEVRFSRGCCGATRDANSAEAPSCACSVGVILNELPNPPDAR